MNIRPIYIFITILIATLELKAETATTKIPDHLPLPHIEETLVDALAQAERILKDTIFTNAEIRVVHHGTSNVPLDDFGIELGHIAVIHLTNICLHSSPFHMTGITPHLRLMNLDLNANVRLLQVTGTYTVSPEIMNYTKKELISSDNGSFNLTFHEVDISGTVGLHLSGHHFFIHTVDFLYKPRTVILKITYTDGRGQEQEMQERRDTIKSMIEEPIYKDLADRLNTLLQEQLNRILRNVTIPDLLENNSDAEISFKTAANNHIGNLNDFVDTILNGTKDNISDQIRIPDLEKTFEKKLGFIRFRGIFRAYDGWIKSLKTLHRTAGVTLKRINNTVEVSAAMGLTTMEFGYSRYSATFLRVGPSGTLTATVGRNSVSFRGRVGYVGNNCTVTLEEIKVRMLNDIEMRLTGLSPFNWILSKVATSIVNRSKNNIIKNIEETVGDRIRYQLESFDCSSYFPKPAINTVNS